MNPEEIKKIKLQTFKETIKFLKRFTNIPPNGAIPYSFFVESGFNAEEAIRMRDEYSRSWDEQYGRDDLNQAQY